MRRRRWLATAVLLAAAAPARGAEAPETPLLEADRRFHEATSQRRVDGWMEFMADDVVLLGPGGPIVGREAVRADRARLFTDNPRLELHWAPLHGEMFPGGGLGYTTGTWTLTGTNAKGAAVSLAGRYLSVWSRQADGAWKVVWDGGAAEPPKPPAPSK